MAECEHKAVLEEALRLDAMFRKVEPGNWASARRRCPTCGKWLYLEFESKVEVA